MLLACRSCMAEFQTLAQSEVLHTWEKLFYDGDRLRAEVSLFGAAFAGHLQTSELTTTVFRRRIN